jgi:hypothetical protein
MGSVHPIVCVQYMDDRYDPRSPWWQLTGGGAAGRARAPASDATSAGDLPLEPAGLTAHRILPRFHLAGRELTYTACYRYNDGL